MLLGSLAVLALVAAWLLYEDGIGLLDLVLTVGLVALVLALYVMYATTAALTRNRLEREASIRRIVTGLSRSLSPEVGRRYRHHRPARGHRRRPRRGRAGQPARHERGGHAGGGPG